MCVAWHYLLRQIAKGHQLAYEVDIPSISDKTADYGQEILQMLNKAGFRADFDGSSEKIGAKIARTHADKVPYMLVVGPKEAESKTVNVRMRGTKETKTIGVDEFIQSVSAVIESKSAEAAF